MPSPTSTSTAGTLAETGEFALVDLLAQRFGQHGGVLVGPGDDAALLAVPSGRVVVTTDLLVEDRHFRRDWASAREVGRRAAAQNISDVNAMGGRATALTVGLGAPPDLPLSWALELADGLAEECALVGASVVGGDLTRAESVVIAVTALGEVDGEPVRRSGARPGDVVALNGRQGWAAAGLAVLTRGFRSPRVLVDAYRRPQPPYDAGPQARALGATAMVDVSDGLLADLAHVADSSGVSIDVDPAALAVDEPLQAVGSALGVDPLTFVLTGGDDHPLAATFPAGTSLPEGWRVVGSVGERGEGPPVTVAGAAPEGATGHTHF